MNAYHRYYRRAVLPQHGRLWLDSLATAGRSVRTLATYAAALVNLRRFLGARRADRIGSVRLAELEAWQQALAAGGCTASSQEQFARTVRHWFGWLHAHGTIFSNPAARLRLPKPTRTLPRCPTEEQVRRLLRVVVGGSAVALRDRALLEVAYASGARLEELARLQLGSMDLACGLVRLCGKGTRERVVPLTRHAVRALRHYLRSARAKLLRGATDHGSLFLNSRNGVRLDSSGIAQVVKKITRKAGFDLTPHDLRRAFATHLLCGGAHIAEVRLLLGHQSYRHLAPYLRLNPERFTERYLRR